MIILAKYMNYRIFVSTVILSIFGLLMVFSAEMYAYAMMGPSALALSIVRQLAFLGAGFFLLYFCYRNFKVTHLAWLTSKTMVVAMFVLLALPRVVFHSYNVSKATFAWIPVFGLATIQPSEFFKLFYILFFAQYVYKYGRYFRISQFSVYYPILFLAAAFFMIGVFQNDLGSAMIIFFIGIGSYIAIPFNHLKKKQLFLLFMFVGSLFFYLFLFDPVLSFMVNNMNIQEFRLQRFLAVFDPLSDTKGSTMQLANGMVAIANGGLFGRGLGNSMMKHGFIPEINNDFILTVIAEELGFVAVCIVIFLYSLIIFEVLKYAQRTKDVRNRIILFGISAYFFAHLFVNMGGVSGLIPMTGVPLLFISSGGSALLTAMMMSGVALAIIKNDTLASQKAKQQIELHRNRNRRNVR